MADTKGGTTEYWSVEDKDKNVVEKLIEFAVTCFTTVMGIVIKQDGDNWKGTVFGKKK